MKLWMFSWLILFAVPAYAFITIHRGDYVYEIYEPDDEIPQTVLDEGRSMYLNTYLDPKLHEGISLKEMGLDHSGFTSYDEFIADMFFRDFAGYQNIQGRFYLQAREKESGKVCGVNAILEESPGNYYKEHLGIAKEHRRKKIATTFLELFLQIVSVKKISLDTRTFNEPAQAFYEKLGFTKLKFHPIPGKQSIYYHYIFEPIASR